MTREITCSEASRYVYRFLDGELEPRSEAELQQHLEACRLCMGVVDFERSMLDFVRSKAAAERVPEELRARIRRALDPPGGENGTPPSRSSPA